MSESQKTAKQTVYSKMYCARSIVTLGTHYNKADHEQGHKCEQTRQKEDHQHFRVEEEFWRI